MGEGIVWAGGQRSQIAAQLPAILRWALGAEHDVRVASVAFLISLGELAGCKAKDTGEVSTHSACCRYSYHAIAHPCSSVGGAPRGASGGP